ncbi:sporulation protein [Streptomyces sp. NPDC000594]|uniref:sporulation protein n=1 Tax=Streptomyces sp. NPDC000594 TaxID=3154261 RepID=UPI0033276EA5
MVFKRLLGSLGVGAPTVDTVLDPGPVLPGSDLTGQLRLTGGGTAFDIEHITLELVAGVEAEHEEGEVEGIVAFERRTVAEAFRLAEGERRTLPFALALPWETPVTELYGQPLGIVLGVRTEMAVAGSRDRGDLDPLAVGPLPAQEAILDAFGRLGFGFRSADLEYGRIGGTGQRLPFYQEIELAPAPRYSGVMNELELTFLAGPDGLEVVLEADRGGALPGFGGDTVQRFTVGQEGIPGEEWNTVVEGWLRRLTEGHSDPYGHSDPHSDPYGHGTPYPGHHDGSHGHHRSGPGTGTMVAAGAAGLAVGVAAGLVAAEVVDEIGDALEEGDEGGDEG